MTTLELDGGVQAIVESSNAWDVRYKLPLVPIHQNPAIYCAYLFKLIKDRGVNIPDEWEFNMGEFYQACFDGEEVRAYPGCLTISHDDMIGWAFLRDGVAIKMLLTITKNSGFYGHKDVSRLIFLGPFIAVCAFKSCSYFMQLCYSAHILHHGVFYNKKSPQDSGTLKIWLMNDRMQSLPLCAPIVFLWRRRMKKLGVTIHKIFSERYLTDVPVFEILSRGMNGI